MYCNQKYYAREVSDFILDPEGSICKWSSNSNIYFIREAETLKEGFEHNSEIISLPISRNGERMEYPSGVNIFNPYGILDGLKNWVWIPWNLSTLDNLLDFWMEKQWEELVKESGEKNPTPKQIWNWCEKAKKEKIKELKEYMTGKNLNQYCMCMYSGLYEDPEKIGALYTGDYNAQMQEFFKQLKFAFRKEWETISMVQVPHHGSNYSYNPSLIINPFFTKMIISDNNPSKEENRNKTVKEIFQDGGIIYITGSASKFLCFIYFLFDYNYPCRCAYLFHFNYIMKNYLINHYKFVHLNVGNEYF